MAIEDMAKISGINLKVLVAQDIKDFETVSKNLLNLAMKVMQKMAEMSAKQAQQANKLA